MTVDMKVLKISTAMEEMKEIEFRYDGELRKVAPHLLGEKTNGSLQLSAYQVGGYSKSGDIPAWKSYKIEKIEHIVILEKKFRIAGGYNPNDKTMSKIFKRV